MSEFDPIGAAQREFLREVYDWAKSSRHLELGIKDHGAVIHIVRGRHQVMQINFAYRGKFCRLINWARMYLKYRKIGQEILIGDDPEYTKIIDSYERGSSALVEFLDRVKQDTARMEQELLREIR